MSSTDDDAKYSPRRRRSSTPDTPRKRRRLGSLDLDAAGLRKHDLLRRREVEANYNDDYRVFFNREVIQAATRFELSETALHYTKQVGSSTWSGTEQAAFFASLERLGKDDLPGIAGAIGTKSESEARDFLLLIQDAAAKQGDAKVTLRDIPAAIEVGPACDQKLEDAGDALAWYQETFEAAQEQERFGEYWLITPSIAEDIEDALNGNSIAPTPSRPASASGEREPSRYGKGVAGYVHVVALSTMSRTNVSALANFVRKEESNATAKSRVHIAPDAMPIVSTRRTHLLLLSRILPPAPKTWRPQWKALRYIPFSKLFRKHLCCSQRLCSRCLERFS
jgi:hypothetical protein